MEESFKGAEGGWCHHRYSHVTHDVQTCTWRCFNIYSSYILLPRSAIIRVARAKETQVAELLH